MQGKHTKRQADPITPENGIRVGLNQEQKEKLDEMCRQDRRKRPEFIRLMIEEEWMRREARKSQVGPAAVAR